MHRFDPVLGWVKLPGVTVEHASPKDEFQVTFTTNAHGLRDDELPLAKPAGETRVLFLGDSFTLGYTVERSDLFVELVESGLRAEGMKIQCINGGTEGWSTDQEALWFDRVGRTFSPDLVVLVLYQNDIYWNTRGDYLGADKPLFGETPEGLAPLPRQLRDSGIGEERLADRSAILSLVLRPGVPMAGVKTSSGTRRLPEEFCVSLRDHKQLPLVERAYATTDGILGWLQARCAAAGCKLAIALVPDKSQVHEDDLAVLLRSYELEPQDWDAHRPTREIARRAAARAIPCLDPTAGFVKLGRTQRLYFEHDRHLSPAGNRLLATLLRPEVKKWLRG
jgi:lysophospholipase L1-like esterase